MDFLILIGCLLVVSLVLQKFDNEDEDNDK